jgi:hypothetical protein
MGKSPQATRSSEEFLQEIEMTLILRRDALVK